MIVFTLNEKYFDINREVDWVYTRFYKKFINKFEKEGVVDTSLLPSKTLNGNDLIEYSKNQDVKDADDAVSLFTISFGIDKDNAYIPHSRQPVGDITFGIPRQVLDLMNNSANRLGMANQQRTFLENELTAERLKGTIHHELSHWMSDALRNRNIKQRLDKAQQTSSPLKAMNKGKDRTHQFLTDYELDAQLHAIVQYRRKNKAKWDKLSFNDAMNLMPFYFPITSRLSTRELAEWKRYMLKRLAREGILGKRMKYK